MVILCGCFLIAYHQLPTIPTVDDFKLLSRHFRSESANNISMGDDEVDASVMRFRPRARSLRYRIKLFYLFYFFHFVLTVSYLSVRKGHLVRSC